MICEVNEDVYETCTYPENNQNTIKYFKVPTDWLQKTLEGNPILFNRHCMESFTQKSTQFERLLVYLKAKEEGELIAEEEY